MLALAAAAARAGAQPAPSPAPFLWGAASAAYQVEGAYQADGKGRSNWDVWTNDYGVTRGLTGEKQTGNVAINAYDRAQYLHDIALMKRLGVNAYRFSIAWTRILPGGTGAVNAAGVAHYGRLVDDLLAAGIEPVVTINHFDYPQALEERGGWANPESVRWYEAYANVVFRAYGSRVKHFITFNEPYIDLFLSRPLVRNAIAGARNPLAISDTSFARQAIAAHHLLLANATAIRDYHRLGLRGSVGITLNLSPTIPADSTNPADVRAAALQDGLVNRWFLDALFKGRYPEDVLALHRRYAPAFAPTADEMRLIASNRPDFLGVNFYAPAYVRANPAMAYGVDWMTTNPDSVPMFNGPVRPDAFRQLLLRLKNEYGNPPVYVTENGAGFGPRDEQVAGDTTVRDPLRADYLRRHVDAMERARQEGADVRGYFVWSMFDNFEWVFGYTRRFGIVYVDFATQRRIPKQSFFAYQQLIPPPQQPPTAPPADGGRHP